MNVCLRSMGFVLSGLLAVTACDGASLADSADSADPAESLLASSRADDAEWLVPEGAPGWFVFAARTVARAEAGSAVWALDAWSASHRGLSLDELLELMNVRVAAPVERCVRESSPSRSWVHLRDAVVSFQAMELVVVQPDGEPVELEPRRVSSAGGVARGVVYGARLAPGVWPDRLTLAVGERFAAPDLPLPVPIAFVAVDGVPVGGHGEHQASRRALRGGFRVDVAASPLQASSGGLAPSEALGGGWSGSDGIAAGGIAADGGSSGAGSADARAGAFSGGARRAGAVTELLLRSPSGSRWVCGVDLDDGVDVPPEVVADLAGAGLPVTATLRSSHVVPVTDASGLAGVAVAESIDHLILSFDR